MASCHHAQGLRECAAGLDMMMASGRKAEAGSDRADTDMARDKVAPQEESVVRDAKRATASALAKLEEVNQNQAEEQERDREAEDDEANEEAGEEKVDGKNCTGKRTRFADALDAERGAGGARGLRQFSLRVCEKVEAKNRTTYNEVADELVGEISKEQQGSGRRDSDGHSLQSASYDEKNIRRRVYDAINVLMAMGVIVREKKEIRWSGMPLAPERGAQALRRERESLISRLRSKVSSLQCLCDQAQTLQALMQRNAHHSPPRSGTCPGVPLPFVLVQSPPDATVDVEISEDQKLVHFDFNGAPFEVNDENYVLRHLDLQQWMSGIAETAPDGARDAAYSVARDRHGEQGNAPVPRAQGDTSATPSGPPFFRTRSRSKTHSSQETNSGAS